MALDWLMFATALGGIALAVVGALVQFGIVDEASLGLRLREGAAVQVVAETRVERIDPGVRYAPEPPVFDPGGREPRGTAEPGLNAPEADMFDTGGPRPEWFSDQ